MQALVVRNSCGDSVGRCKILQAWDLGAICLDRQHILEAFKSAKTVQTGLTAAVAQYCGDITLPEIANELVPSDDSRKVIPPGTLSMALVVNIFGDRKAPYRAAESSLDMDLELILDVLVSSWRKPTVSLLGIVS